ncbi:MAG: pyridoxine 5'-phosphate synthase [Myxococcales bacterium]|nr:MAG: pyridoxine 5'-phosphate synthase [Myxococcales bacterium]
MTVRLQVNVDHVATLRQARGELYPDPLRAAILCERAGADGITIHLREDRRHIQDHDLRHIRKGIQTRLNLEMAATDEMLSIALQNKPDCVTLVPEKRQERTTEGGLDVVANPELIRRFCTTLQESNIAVSLFIGPDIEQVEASIEVGASAIELHTGELAHAREAVSLKQQMMRLQIAAAHASNQNEKLSVAAGHGLTLDNVQDLVREVPELSELNIGHALISESLFCGLEQCVGAYRRVIQAGVKARSKVAADIRRTRG